MISGLRVRGVEILAEQSSTLLERENKLRFYDSSALMLQRFFMVMKTVVDGFTDSIKNSEGIINQWQIKKQTSEDICFL